MIPTMIVFGLIAGRWPKTALTFGAVGWAVILLHDETITISQILGAALFGLVNTGVGVGIHQGVLWLIRHVRGSRSRMTEQAPTLVA